MVDVFDALMSKRAYKEPLLVEEALKVLRDRAGKHFDPDVISTFEFAAPALYGEIGQADKSYLQAALKAIINEYF